MSEYRRFFSYIYAYEQQKKTSNAGFAKIETRGNTTTIELHLRGVHLPTHSICLYLYVRNDESIQGYSLGDVPISGGNVDWRFTINQPRLSDSGYEISDASGIVLLNENEICFVSQWDEASTDWSTFHIYEEKKEEETKTIPPSFEEKVMQSTELPQPDSMPPIFTVISNDPVPQQENASHIAHLQTEKEKLQNTGAKHMRGIPPLKAPIIVDRRPENNASEAFHKTTWADIWQELLKTQPLLKPFSNEDIRCVRIELKDLRMLPSSNWYLCNNSFLLRAFFMHRHLILGENPSVKNSRWFIGVPGIRYQQEHVLAAIFGFQDFLPDKESTDAAAPFGYWYRTMIEED